MDAGAKPTWMYLRRPQTKHSGVKSRGDDVPFCKNFGLHLAIVVEFYLRPLEEWWVTASA